MILEAWLTMGMAFTKIVIFGHLRAKVVYPFEWSMVDEQICQVKYTKGFVTVVVLYKGKKHAFVPVEKCTVRDMNCGTII
jgi:microsomal dipeptidase-like Zn-dependent dipeptidase